MSDKTVWGYVTDEDIEKTWQTGYFDASEIKSGSFIFISAANGCCWYNLVRIHGTSEIALCSPPPGYENITAAEVRKKLARERK